MKKPSGWYWCTQVAWLVTALISMNWGTWVIFRFNFFDTEFFRMNVAMLAPIVFAFIGLCGLFSFILFVMHRLGDQSVYFGPR